MVDATQTLKASTSSTATCSWTHRHVYGRLGVWGSYESTCSNTCGSGTVHTNTNSDMPSDGGCNTNTKASTSSTTTCSNTSTCVMDDWELGIILHMLEHVWKWDIHPNTNSDMPSEMDGCNTNTKASTSSTATCSNTSTCVWTIGRMGIILLMLEHVWKWDIHTNTNSGVPSEWRMQQQHPRQAHRAQQHAATHRHVYGRVGSMGIILHMLEYVWKWNSTHEHGQ